MQRSILQAVISDQNTLKWKPSDIERQHISFVEDDSVVVISGIRRCGKSTLLQAVRAENKEQDYYLNFDDERLIQFKVEDWAFIKVQFGAYFDENDTVQVEDDYYRN